MSHPGFLVAMRRKPGLTPDATRFPWSLPLLQGIEELAFPAPVTFLVGENGSGKSTLLEGMAVLAGCVAAGSHDLSRDPSLGAARDLAGAFLPVRRHHARTRLFLRAEDVFGYTGRLGREMTELEQTAQELSDSLPDGAGRARAVAMARGERAALARRYGENPDGRSHGETFLALLRSRLAPKGLYLLDEPETPLSPTRVLALLCLIHAAVANGSQFIIATHSPILLALPGATILSLEDGVLRAADWNDLEHVRVTRAFLNDPEAVLRRLAL